MFKKNYSNGAFFFILDSTGKKRFKVLRTQKTGLIWRQSVCGVCGYQNRKMEF